MYSIFLDVKDLHQFRSTLFSCFRENVHYLSSNTSLKKRLSGSTRQLQSSRWTISRNRVLCVISR